MVHNSFLQSFTEEGFLGGTLFLGAFVCGISTLSRWGPPGDGRGGEPVLSPEMQRLRLYMLAIAVALGVGMMSLSRSYTAFPYLILGLIAAYCRLAARAHPDFVPPLNSRLAIRLAGLGIVFLFSMKLFVTVFARWDVAR